MRGSKFPADMYNHMMSYLHTKFHENRISSFRGVAMTRFWDGQTDGVTRLLDLLSPLATQVKICLNIHLNKQFIKTVCEIKYEVFESNICYFLKVNIPKGSYFPQHLTYLSLLCFCMLWSLFYNDASIKRISF